jgi:hypothetical protein
MTPDDYTAIKSRLGLTHEALAELLAIHPVTSRGRVVNETTARLLRMIEHVGVDEARRILTPDRAHDGDGGDGQEDR